MDIKRAGSQPVGKGPGEWFTGRFDRPAVSADRSRARGRQSGHLRARPRTAWHTHPLGQTLIVIAGCGRAQREGGPIEEIWPGDVVAFAPREKYWHGAAPTTAMTHIAIQERLDGKAVDWMEKVSDEHTRAERPFRPPRTLLSPCRANSLNEPAGSRPFQHAGILECDLDHTVSTASYD